MKAPFGTDWASAEPMSDINIVPLVDVLLVLLVIFIVTAPLLTNVVKLDLPKASSSVDIVKPDKITLATTSVLGPPTLPRSASTGSDQIRFTP